jgi:multiple sugar transport system ATP-binding protein
MSPLRKDRTSRAGTATAGHDSENGPQTEGAPGGISVRSVSKRYLGASRLAVDDVDLEIRPGEFMVLVGPSGCGKTTLLRMIAGLETVTSGQIHIAGRDVTHVPERDRDIAMVFQNYALYPHLNVEDNIGFGLRVRRLPKPERRRRVGEVARTLGLEELLSRKPAALSGGQRQRVAMGRAIIREPAAFLMDEPLSNLDAQLRADMRVQIRLLHDRLRVTTVYVTHDQVEAMTLGDRVAVVRDGVLQQVDTAENLYASPCNTFVASFIGQPRINLMSGRLERGELHAGPFRLAVPDAQRLGDRDVAFGVRPANISVAGPTDPVSYRASIDLVERLGDATLLFVPIAAAAADPVETAGISTRLCVKVDPGRRYQPGEEVALTIDPAAVLLFDAASGERLDLAGRASEPPQGANPVLTGGSTPS